MKNYSILWTIIRIAIAIIVILTIMKICGVSISDIKNLISNGINILKDGINQIKVGV